MTCISHRYFTVISIIQGWEQKFIIFKRVKKGNIFLKYTSNKAAFVITINKVIFKTTSDQPWCNADTNYTTKCLYIQTPQHYVIYFSKRIYFLCKVPYKAAYNWPCEYTYTHQKPPLTFFFIYLLIYQFYHFSMNSIYLKQLHENQWQRFQYLYLHREEYKKEAVKPCITCAQSTHFKSLFFL